MAAQHICTQHNTKDRADYRNHRTDYSSTDIVNVFHISALTELSDKWHEMPRQWTWIQARNFTV